MEPAREQRPSDSGDFEIMLPLGNECFVSASILQDQATGARFRAARLISGLSLQDVVQQWNQASIVRNNVRHILTAALVQTLETDPANTPIWVFEATAFGIGKTAAEIMEMDVTRIVPDDSESGL